MTKKKISICFGIIMSLFIISLASASITNDLLSDNCTKLDVTINEHESQAHFYFNSESYGWDEFSIQVGDFTLNNLYLSDLLSSFNFKIESTSFTYFNIEEASTLYYIIDGYLQSEDYNFSVDDLNNNLSLVNSFVELDDEFFKYIEKSGNNYIYSIDKGHKDINKEEIISESSKVFYIGDVLKEIGIKDIYEIDFSIEFQGMNELGEGSNKIIFVVNDGEEIFNKEINVVLNNYEEVPQTTEQEKENDDSSSKNNIGSVIKKPKSHLISKADVEYGYYIELKKYDSANFTLNEKHSVSILEIYDNGQVKLRIQSNPIYSYMEEGDKNEFNLSENETLSIEIMSVGEDKVGFILKGKSFVSPEKTINLGNNKVEETRRGFFKITGDFIRENSYKLIPVIFLILFASLITLIIFIKNKLRRLKK